MLNQPLYSIETTQDGSPTVLTRYSNGVQERMHHAAGALSETILIYEPAIREGLSHSTSPTRVLSVGLGLGYNELLTAALCISSKRDASEVHLLSFESSDFLRSQFLTWLGEGIPSSLQPEWRMAYEQICNRLATHVGCETGSIKARALESIRQGHWQLLGALKLGSPPPGPFHVILYDAFSRKMDPDLWLESDLQNFLGVVSGPHCVLATYAKTGSLNRALRANHFIMEEREGFAGKRESTLARRNCEKIH